MSELAALVRFVHLVAALVLAGGLGFQLIVAQPAFAGAVESASALKPAYWRQQLQIYRWCVVCLSTTLPLALWLQAANVSGSVTMGFRELLLLLTETQFGKVWLARLTLLVFIAAAFGSRRVESPSSHFLALLFSLSVCLSAALVLAGHAAAADGVEFAARLSADALHLLASAVWFGGLMPLALLLKHSVRSGAADVARAATRRFSTLALASVLIIIATGLCNAWTLVGGFAPLFGTLYGKLLLAKLGLFLAMLAVGAANLLLLKPRITAPGNSDGGTSGALRSLSRNVVMEILLGLVILLIVGHMGITPPARHVQPEWPLSFRWDWSILEKAPKALAEIQRGAIWFAIGVVALVGAILRREKRVPATLISLGALSYGVAIAHQAVMIDAYPDTYKRPAVAYQAISIANGAALYQDSGCAGCHGVSGHGDGPTAPELNPPPPDLTARHATAHTAGDLFWWLSYGVKPTSAMPGFGQSLSEEERWDLINYVRALSSGEQARNLAPVIEATPWLVAPDFTYGSNKGDSKTLKDHRGNKFVLLVLLNLESTEKRLQQLGAGWPQLQAAGVEVIVVPNLIDYLFVAGKLPGLIVNEGIREISETYKLLARSFNDEDLIATTPHVEFLIDKQGYIRARWLAAENDGWRNLDGLLKQVELLRQEKSRAPAPDDHVH